MRNLLKKIGPLDNLNAVFKSYYQEQQAKKSLEYYRKQISRNLNLTGNSDVARALKTRLLSRDTNPTPKSKGELHIFLAFALSSWEGVLPLVLQPFGKVTVFEWRSLGFNDHLPNWLKYRDLMNAEMLKAFQKAYSQKSVDVVVGYLSGYNTSPQILYPMCKRGTILLNFCWDDKLNFPGKVIGGRYTSPAAIAAVVDLNLTNSPESCIKYAGHGGLAMFWPEAAHPHIHKPCDDPFEFDVSFVGKKYGWRPRFISELQKMGIKVTCFGNSWENGPLTDEGMVKLYSRSRINLGFAGVGHSRKLMCIKGRDFEVPMSGGLYLTQNNPELSLVYDIGKEIMTYTNKGDCAKKIRWLLDHPIEADKIRKAGRKRALKDHTWEKRFEDVFRLTGIME